MSPTRALTTTGRGQYLSQYHPVGTTIPYEWLAHAPQLESPLSMNHYHPLYDNYNYNYNNYNYNNYNQIN